MCVYDCLKLYTMLTTWFIGVVVVLLCDGVVCVGVDDTDGVCCGVS